MILSLSMGMYLTHLLKLFFHIPRPWVRDARIRPGRQAIHGASGYSFPSSHTEIAASDYGALGTAVPKFRKACIGMIILTGLSRMFLVVHYPTDIIGGLLAGALAAVGGWFITKGLLALIHSHDNAFCRGFLSFDAAAPIKRIFSKNSPR